MRAVCCTRFRLRQRRFRCQMHQTNDLISRQRAIVPNSAASNQIVCRLRSVTIPWVPAADFLAHMGPRDPGVRRRPFHFFEAGKPSAPAFSARASLRRASLARSKRQRELPVRQLRKIHTILHKPSVLLEGLE